MTDNCFILLSLSKLINKSNKKGFVQLAKDINDILYEIILNLDDNDGKEEQDIDDKSVVVNTVGLRGDTKSEQPTGGFALEPFFFDSGDLGY
jgi:hypothetical protein